MPQPPAPVAVRVLDPLDERHGLKSVRTYQLLTLAPSGHPMAGVHSVRRRYNDFAYLRDSLSARYAGMVIPPLPSKGGVLGLSSTALAERLRGLALFAERLARIPTLLMDTLASSFFGLPGSEEWEAAVRFEGALRACSCQCFSTDAACQNLDPRSGLSVSNCPKKGRHPRSVSNFGAPRGPCQSSGRTVCQSVKVSNFGRPRGPYYPTPFSLYE